MEQVIATHRNTDFDAMASLICGTLLYPGAAPILPRAVNANVKAFLSIHKDIFETISWEAVDPDRVRRLVVVDVNRWDRLGRVRTLREKPDLEILLWDHHPIPGDIGAAWQCQEPMGATITLMLRKLMADNRPLGPMQATLFLAGIYEDTGSLLFPATRPEDARAAAFLLENGADLTIVANLLRPAYGEKQKDVLFNMLRTLRRESINGHTISINAQKIDGHVGELSVVVNMYRQILNVDAAFGIFTVREKDDRCMVIGRSAVEGLDMGTLMRGLGGGGHPGAGSAMLKSARPEAVEAMIRELIRGNQQASVQISDLMSFPVATVPPDIPMREAAAILRQKGCTGMPVVDGEGRILGIISRRDFTKLRKDRQLDAPVKAFMSTSVVTIEPGTGPMQAVRLMVRHDIGRLPVVEEGRLIGIVTRSDAMTYFYDLLPA
jgi:nanoRNase/pAp phosphatase (c-di-AMP/oligoRNAs hydrolase)